MYNIIFTINNNNMKIKYYFLGLISGVINGLFGSGGGLIAVPLLEKTGIDAKKSHATSIAIILPLSIISTIFYLYNKSFNISDALPYIPFGVIGAIVGSMILKRISNKLLHKIFGGIIIISAFKMLFS